MRRFLPLFVVCCLLVGSLTSCEGTNHPIDNGTGVESEITADLGLSSNIPLIQNGSTAVTIAYANGEYKAVKSSIALIQSVFSQNFGVETEKAVQWDLALVDRPCIVFGNIGDDFSQSIYDGLRSLDYSVSVHENRIYICARSSDTYALATNTMLNYLKNLVGKNNVVQDLSLSEDYAMRYDGKYSITEAYIAGTELKDMAIIEPTDANIQAGCVDLLQEKLFVSYGYKVERKTTEVDDRNYIRMEIDSTMEPMHYGYRVEDGNLILVSGGAYSMKYAAQDILSLLRPDNSVTTIELQNGDSSIVSLLDNPNGLDRPEDSNLRVMSANLMASFDGWDSGSAKAGYSLEMRGEIFDAYLKVYDPDIVGMQEVCDKWYTYLNRRYDANSPWKIVTGGGSRIYFLNPILYRADRYQLVTEGWVNYSQGNSQAWGGRYMTWAVFDSIATGERFALVNLHWTGVGHPEMNAVQATETLAKLKELQSAYNCQVCITGDFNTADFIAEKKGDATVPNPDISHTEYTYMLADGTVKDAKFYAETLVNDIGSVHGFGAAAYPRTWSYDHIFCTADTMVRQFYTAWDNDQKFSSDHAWLIADIDLSVRKKY